MKIKTKTICLSRNVKWLGKSGGEYFGTKDKRNTDDTQYESSDHEEIEPTQIKKAKVKKLEGKYDSEDDEKEPKNESESDNEYESSLYQPLEGDISIQK